jgi:hypothetical protein
LCSEQFGTKIGKISAAEPEREPQKNNLPCWTWKKRMLLPTTISTIFGLK